MTVDQALINEPTLALLSGTSKERGKEAYMIFPNSVNIAKFKEYLTKLREENEGEKICIFMDNLTTHTSQKSKDAMRNSASSTSTTWLTNPTTTRSSSSSAR